VTINELTVERGQHYVAAMAKLRTAAESTTSVTLSAEEVDGLVFGWPALSVRPSATSRKAKKRR